MIKFKFCRYILPMTKFIMSLSEFCLSVKQRKEVGLIWIS